MPAAFYYPEDMDAMRAALQAWAVTASGLSADHVVWKDQSAPAPGKPYVGLKLIVPPTSGGIAWRSSIGRAVEIPSANVHANTTYTVTINGIDYAIDSGANPTSTTIRDALIAAIDAGLPGAAATIMLASGQAAADALLVIQPEPMVIAVDGNMLLRIVEERVVDSMATLSVDVFADPRPTDGGPTRLDAAVAIAVAMERSLDAEDVLEPLRNAGWAVHSQTGMRNFDEVMGAYFESRAGFDVRLSTLCRWSSLIDFIESASLSGTAAPGVSGAIQVEP